MELLFKNITKSSKKIYDQFLDFHNKRYKKRDNIQKTFFIIAASYMIIFNIIHNEFRMVLIISLLAAIYLVGNNYQQKKVVKKEYKSDKVVKEKLIVYYFYDKKFEIELNNQKQEFKYYQIYRIHQDEYNIYLYTDKTHTFIIDKNGFEIGTMQEFRNFLRQKCKLRFKK